MNPPCQTKQFGNFGAQLVYNFIFITTAHGGGKAGRYDKINQNRNF